MKKFTVMVKTVLMSTITAVMFATMFTACSDEMENEAQAPAAPATANVDPQNPPTPLGLKFQDFITPTDVQILNADTTQISVSKALADKLGITDFVGHPMGIWQSLNERSYLRRATKQELKGDRYVLTVERSSLAEVLAGQAMELNTSIMVNPEGTTTRSGATDKYTDNRGIIHPMAVSIERLPGETTTRSGQASHVTLTAEQILAGEGFQTTQTRGSVKKWVEDFMLDFIKSGGHLTCNDHGRIVNLKGTLVPKELKLGFGAGKNDSLILGTRIPYDVSLDYTLKLDTYLGIKTDPWSIARMIINPFSAFTIDTKYFESRLDGEINVKPEISVGVKGKVEIPKDKQNLKLIDLGMVTFYFQIGPAPVAVSLFPALYLHLDAMAEGRIYTGFEYDYQSKFYASVKYENNDWSASGDYKTVKDDFKYISPRATVKAKAGAGVLLGVDVTVDYVAGPTFSVGPMVTSEMNAKWMPYEKNPFTFDFNVKLGLHGRAGAKLKAWKFDIADWQTDITFGNELTLFEFKYDGKAKTSNGDDKLAQQTETLVKEMEADAAKKKAQRDAAGDNRAQFENFKRQMERDLDINGLLRSMRPRCYGSYRPVDRTDEIYEKALNATFDYAVDEFVVITPDHFQDMKNYLQSCIAAERNKMGL